jgi:hypothetical protein
LGINTQDNRDKLKILSRKTSKNMSVDKLTYLMKSYTILFMLNTYTTSQIANMFNLHPNTIRLYEVLGFISAPERKANGYRIFTEKHIKQIDIARLALRAEVLQNGLRKKAI